MNYESIILDIDGTLWDSRALVAEGYNIQLREEGLPHLCVDAGVLKPLFGKVQEEIADVLFASIPVPERYSLMDRCMEREQEHMYRQPCDIGSCGTVEKAPAVYRQQQRTGISRAVYGKTGPDSLY